MPVILATQHVENRRITFQRQPGQIVRDPIMKNPITKKGLVEWLKPQHQNK
jgi:hypothetical protein